MNKETTSQRQKETSSATSDVVCNDKWLERQKEVAEKAEAEEKSAKMRRDVHQMFGLPPKELSQEEESVWYEDQFNKIKVIRAEQMERVERERKEKMERYNAMMNGTFERKIDVEGLLRHISSGAVKRDTFRLNTTTDNSAQLLSAAYRSMVESRGLEFVNDQYMSSVISSVSRWMVNHKKPGLIMRGNVGVGKSTILQAIRSIYAYAEQKGIHVYDARVIINMARNSEKDYEELIKKPMLGIDDLGTEPLVSKSYGNESSPITDLIAYRYDKQLFTIITTNLTTNTVDGKVVDEISEVYGERTFDRLKEMCNFLQFDGHQQSYRR